MRNLSLEEKVKQARAIPFRLPPKVSFQKTLLPEGRWAYVYRHEELGNLGRMVLLPHATVLNPMLDELMNNHCA